MSSNYSYPKLSVKMNWFTIFCCINLLNCVSNEELESNTEDKVKSEEDVFIPTHEWQIVKKGQSIPKGLHVRINLETGLTEAKLLEEELREGDKKNALLTIYQPEQKEEEKQNLENSKDRLKEALRNIKNEDLTVSDEIMMKRVTEKFKKYEEIKKDLDELNLAVKTDAELLRELVTKYENHMSSKTLDKTTKALLIYNVLEDIDYLVHQIDNAREFINLDGFKRIIYKNFNSSSSKIKCQVLNILGSCTQNNPKVQIYALETGAIDKILRILALENDSEVLSRALYAISSLLRRFPLAQQQYIRNGGLSAFSKIFEKPQKIKIQLRIITLLYDLLMEHNNALKDLESPDYKEKLKQYRAVDLKNRLGELKWCDLFSNVLKDVLHDDPENHDSIEKCLNVMYLVQDICKSSYTTPEMKKIYIELNNKYKKLSEQEIKENSQDPDVSNHIFYFQKMKELTDSLIKSLNILLKTEL